MIIVVEGPSAAGKTTWVTAHSPPGAVIGEMPGGPAPDRIRDPDGAAAHWARLSAGRWHAARQAEQTTGIAVCDTDPLKLHYIWSLWRTGHASTGQWRAELSATRQLFTRHQLGLADLILVDIPDPATLTARAQGDTTRRRRNFGLHRQLAGPLRDWYHAIEQLDPARVHWALPATGLPETTALRRRHNRTSPDTLDALIHHLPAR